MMTIGQLARRFGLSRSTLLYYDRIGLVKPSKRSASNYRLYSEDEVARMELVDTYRRGGMPLADIAALLDTSDRGSAGELLEHRLEALNRRSASFGINRR